MKLGAPRILSAKPQSQHGFTWGQALSTARQAIRGWPRSIARALGKTPASLWNGLSWASSTAKGKIESAALLDPESIAKYEKNALAASSRKARATSMPAKRL